MAPLGYDLEWSLLKQEIMRVGGVDLHGDIAESVPLFVHPANPTLTLYAAEALRPARSRSSYRKPPRCVLWPA